MIVILVLLKLKSWLRSELTNSRAWASAAELRPEDQEVAKLASFAMVAANKAKFEEKARRMTLPGYIEGGSDDEDELTNTSGASGRLNYRAFDVTVAVLAARAEFEQVCGQAAPRPTPPVCKNFLFPVFDSKCWIRLICEYMFLVDRAN